MPAKSIMSILQKLYENGYITYHRTDSTTLSDDCKESIKNYKVWTKGCWDTDVGSSLNLFTYVYMNVNLI